MLTSESNILPQSFQNLFEFHKKNNFSLSWLFYGIGNIGRSDDGLAIRLIESIEALQNQSKTSHFSNPFLKNLSLNCNYQINIEDALEISKFDVVVFVDATKDDLSSPFQFTEIKPRNEIQFSTHTLSFESLLALSNELYLKNPHSFLLKMKGFNWEINDQLSAQGEQTLQNTLAWFQNL